MFQSSCKSKNRTKFGLPPTLPNRSKIRGRISSKHLKNWKQNKLIASFFQNYCYFERKFAKIMPATRQAFIDNFSNPFKMKLYFLQKLPSLFFWGVQIKSISPERGQTRLPYGWRTQNPFQSTYFAAQNGAAELSTGMLALLALSEQAPCSMLIVGMEASFIKKATNWVTFTCEEGPAIQAAVQKAVETGEPQSITVSSVGVQEDTGVVVAKMSFTWSFKRK